MQNLVKILYCSGINAKSCKMSGCRQTCRYSGHRLVILCLLESPHGLQVYFSSEWIWRKPGGYSMWQHQKNLSCPSVSYSKLLAIPGNLPPVIYLIRLLTLFFPFNEKCRGTPWYRWEFIQCLSVPLFSLYHGQFNSIQTSASTCGK